MDSKAKLISFDPHINTITINIELQSADSDTLSALERLKDNECKFTLTQWRETRSRNANSYFHVLSDKLADHMRMSKPKMKNYLLFHYGQKVRDEDNNLVIIKTNADEESLISRTDIHLWYLKDALDGTPMYVLLEHSRYYDSLQMNILIDGVVQECKAVGIETATPDELTRMKTMWGMESEVKNEKHTTG